ncbi:thymidylate kinase [Terrihabitans soli]|uniref:Thymidylate kinase n=1 Tax=Terrihabitans soli TaxID=708113 RepID=A0A6S6QV84_9HYPH|nr:dTMP kinase [Terrihabitans soli]BCJ91001.1 thymidylate kinase [Terrihabitans soli]
MTAGRRRFITFEGGEGAGKSTQVDRLAARLRARGQEVVTTREPGGSPTAEKFRNIVLSGQAKQFGAFAETTLFAAARLDHLRETIEPALRRGAWVICDRFMDSTRAYQGALGKIKPGVMRALEFVTVGDTVPGLTLLLDLPPEDGLKRAAKRGMGRRADRFESEDIDYHRSLRRAFLDIAAEEPKRIHTIDAQKSPDEVAQAVWDDVAKTFALEKSRV